jgi:tyrosyl-tRNA synthetase
MAKSGGITLNKEKVSDASYQISGDDFINRKYIVVGRGKKYALFVTERGKS